MMQIYLFMTKSNILSYTKLTAIRRKRTNYIKDFLSSKLYYMTILHCSNFYCILEYEYISII